MSRRPPPGRRAIYFAFQGLFMAVLLLLVIFQARSWEDWAPRFAGLALCTAAILGAVTLVPDQLLARWYFHAGLFLADAALASTTLFWTGIKSEFFLLYLLIIFGTALTRNVKQSVFVGGLTLLLYFGIALTGAHGLPHDTGFWLRSLFLVISTSLLAVLALDAQRALSEQENRYRQRSMQVERLAGMGRLAGEVAHRIKGPLTTIMVNAEVLAEKERSKEARRELAEIRREAGRCKEILKNLLDLGRIEELDFSPIDLREPVERAVRLIEPQARHRDIRVEMHGFDSPMKALGDPSLIQEAVSALLQNAVESLGRSGLIQVRLRSFTPGWRWLSSRRQSRRYHEIAVEDDGRGIAAKDLDQIFQPFFTTKEQGSGLGLSAALRILEKHGGTIDAESPGRGRGARFIVRVPVAG
ncbi:MAG: hypothetical protein HY549_13220 [Elusimicrobia bacterium]|nr:hypothetical protein [Elusimicrobiota bacterium]